MMPKVGRERKVKVTLAPLIQPDVIRANAERVMRQRIATATPEQISVLLGTGPMRRGWKNDLIRQAGETALLSAGITITGEVELRTEEFVKRRVSMQKQDNAVRKMAPGADGKFESGTRVVADPLEPGKSIDAEANIRHDVAAWLFSHGQIHGAQFQAAQMFANYVEKAGLSGAPSIDLTKPAVDGGRVFVGIADAKSEAVNEINGIYRLLKPLKFTIVWEIIVGGVPAYELIERSPRRDKERVGQWFRDALEEMAAHWGLAGRQHARTVSNRAPDLSRGRDTRWGRDRR